ncbi:MAG: hypothetical protein Nkreftii_002230 [Candidatus Nitrospira kreftii]|uniref:Uncharacterized protein n=1 Tax=Candidatus Nitrospira kreftii TaxID=2652173 RepID=A0A7S8IZP0_9BACT|nr:MAG: hypothetical protein Nkreftii_002230 [Candidatus Nitrospira kreftii]
MTTILWRAVPGCAEIVVIFVFSPLAGSAVTPLGSRLCANSAPRYVMNVQRYASVMLHIMLYAAHVRISVGGVRMCAAKW